MIGELCGIPPNHSYFVGIITVENQKISEDRNNVTTSSQADRPPSLSFALRETIHTHIKIVNSILWTSGNVLNLYLYGIRL
ncbi:unnamed protein product [Acanthoscelides obtectus]|uniref:Uncharacterized protein n=1 Tax=Acanthoscelides obtectus TaxID=200917 RepID=A0A9P0K954_ACAOB|nr:unnamed protein product [Acanthoscelides obtectus]CAK1671949.1 hypothetical protein AOBTE_LOCUS28558 [Acanthoscelides obtectus]